MSGIGRCVSSLSSPFVSASPTISPARSPIELIPRIVHWIKLDEEPMPLFMYLNFLSVLQHLRPSIFYIHTNHPEVANVIKPYPGASEDYWHKVRYHPAVQIVPITQPIGLWGLEPSYTDLAHQADLLRMLVLRRWGGVYLDTDLLLLRSVGDLFGHAMVLPKQATRGLANTVILASPKSHFLQVLS